MRSISPTRKTIYFLTALGISVVLVRVFVVDTFTVAGNSMAPTIIEGDYVVVNRLAYLFDSPERDDIVVGTFRDMDYTKVIKRVIGLPREWVRIENGSVRIADERGAEGREVGDLYAGEVGLRSTSTDVTYRLDPNEYYLLGDNGIKSTDSREFGPIDHSRIDGEVIGVFRLRSFDFFGF